MSEGNLGSAWPIIGSLTRTVEYLQLSIEVDEQPQQGFLKALRILGDSGSWAEAEERRRVFWNVFILDRCVSCKVPCCLSSDGCVGYALL
jgi:hypothetical protein